MPLSYRPSVPEDNEFLSRLYAGTRAEEIAGLGWNEAQKQAFLSLQFKAQQQWYETAYPNAQQRIVLLDGNAIGRMIVDRGREAVVLVDISLLPEHRARGYGTALLSELLESCREGGIPLRLQVLRTNPAQRLYQRLGFRETGADAIYRQMEWRPGKASSTS